MSPGGGAAGSVPGAPDAANPPGAGWRAPALLAAAVALSRLPFLGPGFGTDTDAWKLAWAAREIGSTGHYVSSRLPGFPIQEFASALVWRGGPLALNGLTALFSVAAAVLLYLAWRRLGGRDGGLTALAFALTPTVYISSVSAMDYPWAMAFLLAALVTAVDGRPVASGVLLGLATGCRVTSAAFLPPLALIAWARCGTPRLWKLGAQAAAAALVAAVCFAPVYRRYGPGFLTYYEPQGAERTLGDFLAGILKPGPAPFPPALIAGQGTVGVFGVIGAAAVALAAAGALVAWLRLRGARWPSGVPTTARALTLSRPLSWACGIAVVITLVLYLRLPHDEGYLIPALPFALVLLGAGAPRGLFRASMAALLVAPFLLGLDVVPPKKGVTPRARSPLALEFRAAGGTLVLDPLRGPLLMDQDKRTRSVALAERTVPVLDRRRIVLAGVLNPVLFYYAPDDPRHPRYVDLLPRGALEDTLRAGIEVLYLPDVRLRTQRIASYDLATTPARPLFPDEEGPPPPGSAAR